MLANNKIYAIIITFNPDIRLLDAAYNSIVTQVDRIIYVDNFSQNQSEIKNWHQGKEKVEFIWLNDNEGLGVAQNMGIKEALDCGASRVIIFDQDSVVDDDFVSCLVKAEIRALEEGVNVGLTGPVYKSYDDSFAYPIWTVDGGKIVKIPQDYIKDYKVVTHLIASGSLIRREALECTGLMREDLFLGYIDFEFCFRATQYGFKSIVTNSACMRHQMGDSQIVIHGRKIGLYSPFRRYFDCRNTILIQRENVFPKVFKRHHLKLIFGKILISLIYGPKRWQQIKYCSRGFYDGLIGKSGKCSIS